MLPKPTDHPLHAEIVKIAAAVQTAERESDAGITSTAQLIIETLRAQEAASLPPRLIEPALAKLRTAMDAHFAGRSAIVAAHLEYGRLAASFGATAENWGPNWPCTTGELKSRRAKRRLSAVA